MKNTAAALFILLATLTAVCACSNNKINKLTDITSKLTDIINKPADTGDRYTVTKNTLLATGQDKSDIDKTTLNEQKTRYTPEQEFEQSAIGGDDPTYATPSPESNKGVTGIDIPENPDAYIFNDHAPLPQVLIGNEKVSVDIGNISNGILKVKYNTRQNTKIKLLVDKDGTRYIYDLPANDMYHWYPLQSGIGTYTITVAENIQGTDYMPVFSEPLDVDIWNEKIVFLNPNQIVWYNKDSRVVKLAWNLVTGLTEDIRKAEAIHKYIINNISYDYDRLSTVKPGYIPDVEQVLESKKGICFDYAALYASMMRALNIPAKLVMGYVSPQNVYHAWNEIYIEGKGWIKVEYARLYDNGWSLVDATFDAGGAVSTVGDGEIYQKKYEY